jgi:hypothetical protein
MSGDSDGINVSIMEKLVSKDEIYRYEIKIMIEIIINKKKSYEKGK